MRRWHNEIVIMKSRHRDEIENHRHHSLGYIEGDCHCLRGIGTMRKRRPYDSCSPGHCSMCESYRDEKKYASRRRRYEGRDKLLLTG